MTPLTNPSPTSIALFITCVADLYRPDVGDATVALLEQQGLTVQFPVAQTCCGAIAHEAGWQPEAIELARRWIEIFEPYETIVSPSPSCVAHVRFEYPRLLAAEPAWQRRAEAVAARTYELSEFLVNVLGITDVAATFRGKLTYQPACLQLRTLQTDAQARALLNGVQGSTVVPLGDAEACCGFGGLLSVRMPQIADAMADRKAKAIEATGADAVVTGEAGCALHLSDALKRRGSACRALHLAELLAGQADE